MTLRSGALALGVFVVGLYVHDFMTPARTGLIPARTLALEPVPAPIVPPQAPLDASPPLVPFARALPPLTAVAAPRPAAPAAAPVSIARTTPTPEAVAPRVREVPPDAPAIVENRSAAAPVRALAPEPARVAGESEGADASPAPAAPTDASAIVGEEAEIRRLLAAYRDSYDRLDAVSAARLWPGVDTAGLQRAFSSLASQQLEFDTCALDVLGQQATARCRGSVQYVRRVGRTSPQSRALSWAFELDRSTGRWLITRVTAQ